MLYGEKGYREKCYIGRNVTEGEMLQGETLQGELLQGELSWGETLYIRFETLYAFYLILFYISALIQNIMVYFHKQSLQSNPSILKFLYRFLVYYFDKLCLQMIQLQ